MNLQSHTNEKSPVRLLAVGDMMFGDCPVTFGFGVGSQIEKYGSDFPFELCRGELQQADILIGNLEATLSAFDWSGTSFERMRLRGQPKAADGLKTAGFDILTLANNHIMQHGRAATKETAVHLKARGIEVTGLELPEIDVSNAVLITKNNLRFGFLSYNQRPEQYSLDPRVDVPADMQLMRRDIAELRNKVDCLVLSLHWGDEFMNRPSSAQIKMAHELVDLGVDIILGHHPHVLQGIERYHRAIIAYSLGNFIFDMSGDEFQRTIILDCIISPSGEKDFNVIPVWLNNSYQPVILTKENDIVSKEVQRLSQMICENQNDDVYYEELQQLNRLYRRKDIWLYFRNALKYSPRHLLANFVGIIKRRL